jgi:hypothetical protein
VATRNLDYYADGDDDWRRRQNDTFGAAMSAAGGAEFRVVEVPGRNHMSLMTEMNAADDRIGRLVMGFLSGKK